MNSSVQTIPLLHLAISFIPVLVALLILFYWSLPVKQAFYAVVRMLVQLLLIGYLLAYIFDAESASIIVIVLLVMVAASAWIALGTVANYRWQLLGYALIAIAIGGGSTLALVTQGVLRLDPWYWPQYIVPLAGMIFANAMNSVSLAAERLQSELERNVLYVVARKKALSASIIPMTNSLLAVGLVSLPGMMTGQILSGVSPFIAARYQIMVMCMIFGSAVIASAIFLILAKPVFTAVEEG